MSFIVVAAPVDRPQFIPEAKETSEEATARYQSIADDIASVVWNPQNPPLFKGPEGRAKTAAIMLGIMKFESGFRKDVDLGVGKQSRGDGGRSWCLMQINIGNGRTMPWNIKYQRLPTPNDPKDEVVQGWTGLELVTDRKKCVEAGYRIMKVSFEMCHNLPVGDWLRVYASGSCDGGAKQSQARVNFGVKWFNANKPTFTDDEALAWVNPPELNDTPPINVADSH